MAGSYILGNILHNNGLMTDLGLIPLLCVVSLPRSGRRRERMKNNALALDKAKS